MASGRTLRRHGRVRIDRELQQALEREEQGRAGLCAGLGRGRRRGAPARDRESGHARAGKVRDALAALDTVTFFGRIKARSHRPDQLARLARVPAAGRQAGGDFSGLCETGRLQIRRAVSSRFAPSGGGRTTWRVLSTFPPAAFASYPACSNIRRCCGAPMTRSQRVRFRAAAAAARKGSRMWSASSSEAGRPLTSFCACELRSPAPVHRAGLSRLQRGLRGHAAEMGPVRRQGQSGRAQQCMSGEVDPPAESRSTRSHSPWPAPRRAELRDRRQRGGDGRVVRATASAPSATARNQPRRLAREGALRARRDEAPARGLFDLCWADTTATQVYTVHDLHPFLADEIVRRGAARVPDSTWHFARPPVRELESRWIAADELRNVV